MTKNEICVLIPAYNEARKVKSVCEAVLAQGYRVVLADDGSTDDTSKIAGALPLTLLAGEKNRGKGAALRRGFEWFLRQNLEAVILMDADGQHDPKELDLFLKELGKESSDLVIGNRMAHPLGMPWIRRATNKFLSWILSALVHQNIPDSQCGYRAIKRRVLENSTLRTERFEIESEIILAGAKGGFKISSIPIQSVYRDETSQIHPVRDTVRFFKFLILYLLGRY